MLVVVIVAVFATTGLLVYATAMKADERLSVRGARARLGDYGEPIDKREEDLLEPLTDRVFQPTSAFVLDVAKQVIPGEYVAKMHQRLTLAGRGSAEELDHFLVMRVLLVVAVPVGWLLTWRLSGLSGFAALAA